MKPPDFYINNCQVYARHENLLVVGGYISPGIILKSYPRQEAMDEFCIKPGNYMFYFDIGDHHLSINECDFTIPSDTVLVIMSLETARARGILVQPHVGTIH